MPRRAASPAFSETEFDISNALTVEPDFSSNADTSFQPKSSLTTGELLAGDDEGSTSDDENFIAAAQAASNRKAANLKGKTVKKGGGFQAMGLSANMHRNISRLGYRMPSPIQRKTIPLIMGGKTDCVAMARTGSGKTAAFTIPLVEKLKAHSARFGARALVMSPSRELALQTFKVIKELGRGTDLRTVLLVGGDSIEDQFATVASQNPDIIVATPGRFLHLKVEMGLGLSSMEYIVFDEADRLFEMGFAAQLYEILHALPVSRQTLLFSATLPKSLVEFAGAGLQDPQLVRLDADSKVSPDLECAFFSVKSAEKEGALLHILQDLIGLETGEPEHSIESKQSQSETHSKKRKRAPENNAKAVPAEKATIVFTATKHHVEYIALLLRNFGFIVSSVYGSMDQQARQNQVEAFRHGRTNILVVTDVAARGLDIPDIKNVINYDFPAQAKIFVHRVGRTARAGRQGWSYSLVQDCDVGYLLDLQLFLGRRLIVGREDATKPNFAEDIILGSLRRDRVESCVEAVNKLLDNGIELVYAKQTAGKGERLYKKTRNSASAQSSQRARHLNESGKLFQPNLLFIDSVDSMELERQNMLMILGGKRQETVFEVGRPKNVAGAEEGREVMKRRRASIDRRRQTARDEMPTKHFQPQTAESARPARSPMEEKKIISVRDTDGDDQDDFEVTVSENPTTKGYSSTGWKDTENFMSYAPRTENLEEDRGYGVHSGGSYRKGYSTFLEAAKGATMELNNDEAKGFAEPSRASRGVRWDKRSKKYVSRANDEDGSKGAKLVRGESGHMIPASFRSGRFEEFKKKNKLTRMPRTGEAEAPSHGLNPSSGRRFKHKGEKAPKEADKFRDDFYKQKKRVDEAKSKRIGRFRDGEAKTELRGVDDVRKQRNLKEKRRQKNARPSKKRRL